MKIQDIVNNLSEDEKLLHKDLIDECVSREKELDGLNLSQSLADLFNLFMLQNIPDENFFKE